MNFFRISVLPLLSILVARFVSIVAVEKIHFNILVAILLREVLRDVFMLNKQTTFICLRLNIMNKKQFFLVLLAVIVIAYYMWCKLQC